MRDLMTFSISRSAMRNALVVVACGASALVGFEVARAAIPADTDALVYTGVLEEDGVLVDGQRAIAIELYDAASGDNLLCRTAPGNVDVNSGRFRVSLAADCAADVRASDGDVFAEVRVA